MPPLPRRRPPARLGSGVTPPASRDAEENALLDMRVLGQSSRPLARVAGPARGHTPKHHAGDARPTRARGHARPSPARARSGARDEDHVSNALVSLSQRSDKPKGPAGEESSSFPFRNDARGAFEKASDVSQRVSSLRVAERSIARASSLAKLVDEKRDACPSSHREDATAETGNALPPSPVRVAKGETFFQREEDPKVSFETNGEGASPFGSRGKARSGSDVTRTNDDDASPASPWFSAARAVGTHALFLEPRLVEKNSSRDRTWDALVLSGIDAARLAEQRGGHGDAEATLRRSKTFPFAASARRENARRHDRGRVVTRREFTDCEKKRLLRNAQRASPYWRACRSDAELLTFAEAFEFVRYARGEHIVRAGDVADFALLVVEGEARLDAARSRDPFGATRAEDRGKTSFGPGTVLGEMALFLGGRRAASVVACGSEKVDRVGGDSESDEELESDAGSEAPDGAADAADGEVVPEDALAKKKKRTETETPNSTYAVRVYFDAFVDFFAAHPVLATRAFGAFANAAAGRLDRWRLANAGESPEKKVSGSGGRKDDVARRRNAREKKKRLREGLRGVSFARAWSEDDLEAVASVARVIDAKPGRPVFPAGASASDFGVLLAGSSFCSDEDSEDARKTFRAPDTSESSPTLGTNVHSFTASAGSMVGAVAFAAALFRPAARPTSVLAGAQGASVAVFDAAALETLDKARPGLGLDLALAAARAAATRRPSLDASDGRDDEDESTSLREEEEEERVSANAFVPSAPEAEVCFPPDARPRRERGKKRNVTRFAEKRTRESDLLRMSASGGFPDEDETRCVSRRYERERRRVERALRAAFSAAGATEGSDLSRVSSRELVFLAASCSTLRFETGQQILRPGDRAAFAGVLVSGAATVVDAEGRVSSSFGAGSVIGESGAFGEAEHHTYRRDAVVGGEDDTVVAVWTPEALRSMCVSDGTTKAKANATPETPETPETPAVAARAARMFVFLCASTAARRAAANAARARRRESFVSTLEFFSDGEEASYASDASSSASDAPRYSSAPDSARSVKARGDEPYDPSSRTSVNDEDVRRLRATLWEWRDALADGAGACDVDALADAMLDGSHEKPQNDDRRAGRLVVSFAPGARVMAAGTVSSATLLVIGGAVDVDVGVAAKNDSTTFTKKETRAKKTFSTRGLGRFAGERAYFERCAPGAEDAFVHASSRAFERNFYAVRPHDAFADERLGCSVIVFEHDALDRLASRAPGTALAMFARMAANAVDAFP